MQIQEVKTVECVCNICFGLFSISAAVLYFLSVYSDPNNKKVESKFREIWMSIDKITWVNLPKIVFKYTIECGIYLINKIPNLEKMNRRKSLISQIIIILSIVLLLLIKLANPNNRMMSMSDGFFFFGMCIFLLLIPMLGETDYYGHVLPKKSWFLFIIPIDIFVCSFIIELFGQIHEQQPIIACISMVLLLVIVIPLIWATVMLSGAFFNIKNKIKLLNAVFLIFVLMCVSFFATYSAFAIGKFACPNAHVPQTYQMLFVNAFCDTLTVFITFKILNWSISKRSNVRIPLAMLIDTLIAGILACFSLYLGLLFSKYSLSLVEVFIVLVGRCPNDFKRIEFSPFFWVMHTSFIPTLFYLFLILLCWMAKTLLNILKKYSKIAKDHTNPFALTSALFAIVAAIFSFLSFIVKNTFK